MVSLAHFDTWNGLDHPDFESIRTYVPDGCQRGTRPGYIEVVFPMMGFVIHAFKYQVWTTLMNLIALRQEFAYHCYLTSDNMGVDA